MQSNPENEQLLEEELESEFTKKGGKILESKNGAPRRWLCAIDDNGEPFDPPGVDPKNVLREINSDRKWVGNNPSEDKLKEIKDWRSDWNDPDPKGKGQT